MASPAIGVRGRWSPPATAQVDWSHPLAAGLGAFVLPERDIVSSNLVTPNAMAPGSGSPWGRTLAGASLRGTGGNQAATVRVPDSIFTGANGFSAFMLYRFTSTTTYNYLWTKSSGFVSSQPTAIRVEDQLSRGAVAFRSTSGGSFSGFHPATTTYYTPSLTQWMAYGISYTDNLVQSAPSVMVYNGGLATSFTQVFGGSGTVAGGNSLLWLGGRPDTSDASEFTSIQWACFAAWSRPLSVVEWQSLTADPFQVLRR